MGPLIIERQNESNNIRCLAAQRQLYSKAKMLFALQIFLSTAVVIVLSIINSQYNIQWLIAIYCVTITIFDLAYLNDLMLLYKKRAATIQEIFDCQVLGITWNTLIEKVDNDVIYRYSEIYKKSEGSFESLKNWYSLKIKNIDSEKAKLICQYSNCSYDKSLRDDFHKKFTFLAIVTAIFVIFCSSIQEVTVESLFVSILLPLLPIIILSIQKMKQNSSSIKSSEKVKQFASDPLEIIKNDTVNISNLSRELQNVIFQNRIDSPLIFDWFYNLSREQLEKEMDYSVENLVKQYQQ